MRRCSRDEPCRETHAASSLARAAVTYRFPKPYGRGVRSGVLQASLKRIEAILGAPGRDYDKMIRISTEIVTLRRFAIGHAIEQRLGTTVAAGPFAGMRWTATAGNQAAGATLLGTYEQELHPYIERLAGFDAFVEVGSAEGYYTVGTALRFRHLSSYGFEIDAAARERADRLAAENGVADRVVHAGRFDPAAAAAIPGRRRFMLVDIEGAELELLPAIPPEERLRWTFLIETHLVGPVCSGERMVEILEATHDLVLVEQNSRDLAPTGPLADFSELDRFMAVLEGRGAEPWLFATPKAV